MPINEWDLRKRYLEGSTEESRALEHLERGECPVCGQPCRDVRGTLFSARKLERETCFRWADDAFTCSASARATWTPTASP